MTIYIATNKQMPTISYDNNNRSLNTEDIVDNEKDLIGVFSKPHIKYVGSDLGCSCGFRHALLDNNEWLEVHDEDENENDFNNSNHQNLVDFIVRNNKGEKNIEILACWEGDHAEPIKHYEIIKIDVILDRNFHFKERGLYIVEL